MRILLGILIGIVIVKLFLNQNKAGTTDIERASGELAGLIFDFGNIHGIVPMQDEKGEYIEIAMKEQVVGHLPSKYKGHRIKYVIREQSKAQ